MTKTFTFKLVYSDTKDAGEKGTTEDEMARGYHYSMHMTLGKLWELVMDREAWPAVIHGVIKSWT